MYPLKILAFFITAAVCLLSAAAFSLAALFQARAEQLLLIWPTFLLVIIAVGMGLFGWFSRPRRQTIGALLVLCLLIAGGEWAYWAWDDSFDTIKDEVDLGQYQPFGEGSKLVALKTPSSLQLSGELPRLDGATALYPLYAAFVQATYPKAFYSHYQGEVMCSKTNRAWERLIEGDADLIFVAQPSQKQREAAAAKGLEIELTPIGHEAFVFFVNAANPVKSLSVNQIQAIYSGQISNWKTLGGLDRGIKAFQRPEGSGSQTLLQKIMAGNALIAAPQADIVEGMGGIIRRAADYKNYPDAIGYSFLYFATEMVGNKTIRLLEINDIAPTRQSIRSKSYPFTADLYAVTIKGRQTAQVRALIDWARSTQGQELVDKTGYVPLQVEP